MVEADKRAQLPSRIRSSSPARLRLTWALDGDLASVEVTNMRSRAVHVLVFDGFADWEPAYALAELRRWGKRTVVVIGFDDNPVVSMGGLRVVPDRALPNVEASDVELLILPGGDLWEGEYPRAAL